MVLRCLPSFFVLPRWCLRTQRLDVDEVVNDADVSVLESSVVDEELLSPDVLVLNDELEKDDGSIGSNESSCSLGLC